MWKRRLTCLSIGALLALVASDPARTAEQGVNQAGPVAGEIVVHLKGGLHVGTKGTTGARPHDLAAWELTSAVIVAGEAYIQLDWRQSDAVRDELLWWRVPRHGDIRQIQAEVTGTMTFKPAKEVEGYSGQVSATPDTPVPVVNVKSLQVQLVGPDGEPQGDQFDRKRVTVD